MSSDRRAVLIGCNNYDSLSALRCPVNNVNTLYDLLTDTAVGGYTDVDRFIRDEPSFAILPRLEEKLTLHASASDALLLYFSGHGKQDALGRLYLAVTNTKETALDSTSIAI